MVVLQPNCENDCNNQELEINKEDIQGKETDNFIFLKQFQEFLDRNNIKLKELFDWILKRNQQEFYIRLKSARIQFWSIVIIIAGIVSGLFSALFTGIILAETFLSILGIIIGYLFYLLKFSAISPFDKYTSKED